MGDTRSTSTSCDICYAAVCGSEQDEGTLHDADAQRLVQHLGVARSGRIPVYIAPGMTIE